MAPENTSGIGKSHVNHGKEYFVLNLMGRIGRIFNKGVTPLIFVKYCWFVEELGWWVARVKARRLIFTILPEELQTNGMKETHTDHASDSSYSSMEMICLSFFMIETYCTFHVWEKNSS